MKKFYLEIIAEDNFAKQKLSDFGFAIIEKALEERYGKINSVTIRDSIEELEDAVSEQNNTQLPKEQPAREKMQGGPIKPEKEKGLVTSERDSGVVDHNLEHPVENNHDANCVNPAPKEGRK